jgi:pentatricopeptide repeat protein
MHKLKIPADVVVWGAIIDALSVNGEGGKALELFSQMKNQHTPNNIILLSLLNGCSHSGLVDEALKLMEDFPKWGLTPDTNHYNCIIIDAVARAGKILEAANLAHQLPKPTVVTWSSILSACVNYNNLEEGEKAFAKACEL